MNHDEENQNVMAEDIVLEYPIPSKCTMKYFHAPINMYKIFVIIQTISLLTVTNANIGNIYLLCNVFMYFWFYVVCAYKNFTQQLRILNYIYIFHIINM